MRADLETTKHPEPSRGQNYLTSVGCWRSLCEDLIYAGAYGGAHYLAQLERRTGTLTDAARSKALQDGDAIAAYLNATHPHKVKLLRAQAAWGVSITTMSNLARHLPKRP